MAEEGHTVILGWSPRIFTIIQQLIIAHADQADSCIAILAERDKVEMEDELRSKLGKTGRMRIVCRTGSPIDLIDLEIVNPQAAQAIIILPSEEEDPDAQVIKTILALTHDTQRRTKPHHIVGVIQQPPNLEVAQIAGRGQVELMLAGDLIARIAAQTCRQPGLSVVYTELLGFDGDEIYFHSEPGLVGTTFGEALLGYDESCVIGLQHADGSVYLNPAMETVLKPNDKVVVIAADNSLIRPTAMPADAIDTSAISTQRAATPIPERTLILGWNEFAPTIISELDNYVAPGSSVTVVATDIASEEVQPVLVASEATDAPAVITAVAPTNGNGSHNGTYRNLHTTFRRGDTTDRRILDQMALDSYDHVIVLSYTDTLEPQQADARTLVTLLHLRDIGSKCNQPFSIVSEMLDSRNRDLAEVTQADDFIVSDKLISLLLAQVAENKELAQVFQDLFDPEGSEIYLKPAESYVQPGMPFTFYTIVEAARQRGEIAIGYRLLADIHNPARAYGVKVNPKKSDRVTFAAGDQVIVLSEQ